MYSQTKIAIPIFQKNCRDVIEVAEDCIDKGADVLEFRIDALENPDIAEIRSTIEEINFPIIATNRINTEGGSFKGSEEERINILYQCCDLADYVDIELQCNDEYINKIHDTGVKTIVSYHDFEKTPDLNEITYIVEKEHELGDIAKVAFMPQDLEDTLTILAVLSHCKDTIAISMGDLGSYTRVMASKFDSPITFAALIILIFIGFLGFTFLVNDTVSIYIDGENVTVTTNTLSNVDTESLNREICEYTTHAMNDSDTNITSNKNKINEICNSYGLENAKITLDSSIGENQMPVIAIVDGTSMLPTLQDGQKVLVNKTHNVNVGDIVVADSAEYGGIIKRVDDINGRSVHLVSDNKNVSYEYINGALYEIKGIETWVDVSDINGVVIDY